MNIQVADSDETVDVADAVFTREYNEALVHQVVTARLAARRQGSRAQKTRSEVAGGGRKPWRQKGTGRARAGTIRSPIWRGGGKTFAARPQNWSQKVNRRMYRAAMQCIVAELVRSSRLRVHSDLTLAAPKTRELAARLRDLALTDVLIVLATLDSNVFLAARNIPHVDVCTVADLDPLILVGHENVLITPGALRQLSDQLADQSAGAKVPAPAAGAVAEDAGEGDAA